MRKRRMPAVERDDGDDELRGVPEGRVEESADARPGAMRQLLGPKTDDAGEWNQRDGCEDEHRDGVRGHRLGNP